MSNNSSSGGVGVVGLLGITFIVLKLTHVIDWEWLWVLAPFWIGLALWLAGLAIFGLVMLVIHLRDKAARKRARAARALRDYGRALR